jgi:hypothetical protein
LHGRVGDLNNQLSVGLGLHDAELRFNRLDRCLDASYGLFVIAPEADEPGFRVEWGLLRRRPADKPPEVPIVSRDDNRPKAVGRGRHQVVGRSPLQHVAGELHIVSMSLDACRKELQEVLEDWILLGIRLGHTLPVA